ncbi:MAG: hypothetical protein EOM40_03250 [Clostridia bacterium]|nr:hypothetical protein [Clostridia bacterium]NCC42990.1 hypothetical protein [Clostridia bacterium]
MTREQRLKRGCLLALIAFIILFFIAHWLITKLQYDTSFDIKSVSPNKTHTLLIRQDWVSRPTVFEGSKVIFRYSKSGFAETVYWNIEWISENECCLYSSSSVTEERYTIELQSGIKS